MPDQASEPPHCNAKAISEAGQRSRVAALASGSMDSTMTLPASTVLRRPPVVWMFMVWNSGPRSIP